MRIFVCHVFLVDRDNLISCKSFQISAFDYNIFSFRASVFLASVLLGSWLLEVSQPNFLILAPSQLVMPKREDMLRLGIIKS